MALPNKETKPPENKRESEPNSRIIEVSEQYFTQIRDGLKTLEIRMIDNDKKRGKIGEILIYKCGEQTLVRKITSVKKYQGFANLSNGENLANALPGFANNKTIHKQLATKRYPESNNLDEENFEAWQLEEISGLTVKLKGNIPHWNRE